MEKKESVITLGPGVLLSDTKVSRVVSIVGLGIPPGQWIVSSVTSQPVGTLPLEVESTEQPRSPFLEHIRGYMWHVGKK